MLPVFLPPTGKGQFATTSFFWSLYATTTQLTLEYQISKDRIQPFNDKGQVLIRSIDLVKVEPVQAAGRPRCHASPNWWRSPAARSRWAAPTATPTRPRPTRSRSVPFALGKYDVTNEQFERFEPDPSAVPRRLFLAEPRPGDLRLLDRRGPVLQRPVQGSGPTPAYDEKTWALMPRRQRLPPADRGAVGIRRHRPGREPQISLGKRPPSARLANVTPAAEPADLAAGPQRSRRRHHRGRIVSGRGEPRRRHGPGRQRLPVVPGLAQPLPRRRADRPCQATPPPTTARSAAGRGATTAAPSGPRPASSITPTIPATSTSASVSPPGRGLQETASIRKHQLINQRKVVW